jgi:hypothetical protein
MAGFQIRHTEFGVFQGECMGMGFWYPMSDMPEQGLCRFPDEKTAQEYIEYLSSPACADPDAYRGKCSVEPFDEETNTKCAEYMKALKASGGTQVGTA